jgi:micrococcal nuclease
MTVMLRNAANLVVGILFSSMLSADDSFSAGSGAFLKLYDGDSLNIRTRLAHIDTPEIKGECDYEIKLALKARDYSQKFIKKNKSISIKVVGIGRYGRPLIEVRSQGRYLNKELVDAGLARAYKGRREAWCR